MCSPEDCTFANLQVLTCLFSKIWSCWFIVSAALLYDRKSIYLLLFHKIYCCFPVWILRPRESSDIGQILLYPFLGKQKCHYRLLCSYQSLKHSFDFCNGRKNDSKEPSVDIADGQSNTHFFFSILYVKPNTCVSFQLHKNQPYVIWEPN